MSGWHGSKEDVVFCFDGGLVFGEDAEVEEREAREAEHRVDEDVVAEEGSEEDRPEEEACGSDLLQMPLL